MKLSELAGRIGAELVGQTDCDVTGVNTLDAAGPNEVSFLANQKYAGKLRTTGAVAVIVSARMTCPGVTLLRAPDPYYAWMQAVVALHGHRRHPHAGAHPKAHVECDATVGEGTIIYPGVWIGPGARIGRDCVLYPNSVVYDRCILGDRVILHAGAVIGADGFGYSTHDGVHHKIPQMGRVILEDDVEIGANACVDRGAVNDTVIGRGTKIDNLVTIGHGVRVGPHGLLVAQVGVAGSTTLGHHVTLAGQVGVAGHLSVGDGVTVAAQSGVTNDVPAGRVMMGSPAMPVSHARRVVVIFRDLPALVDRVRKLEKAIAAEESAAPVPSRPQDDSQRE